MLGWYEGRCDSDGFLCMAYFLLTHVIELGRPGFEVGLTAWSKLVRPDELCTV